MKKIFYILMSAVVALGAVACENAFDDNNLGTNDKVSITVTIDEATKVALGEVVEGKGQKVVFEEGDQLYVVSEWSGADGYFFTFEKNEGGAYVFTCEAEGVGAIVGTKQTIFHLGYTGGMIDAEGNEVAPSPGGYRCNTAAESIKGVGMVASTSNFGEGTISMQVSPILKFSSEYPVTFTSGDTSLFFYHTGWYWGSFKEYTTKTTGTDIYIPLYQPRSNVTFSASIKGEVVKTKVMNFEAGKIYNLGTLEANPEEAADGDPAGIQLAIDGNFADWANITKNVATLPADATVTNIKTLKAYADANNIYGYVEFAVVEDNVKFVMGINLDNDTATGSSNWLLTNVKGCELIISSGTFIEAKTFALYSAPFAWANYSVGDKTMVTATGSTSIGSDLAAVEFAIAREKLNALMTSPNIGVGITTYGANDKKLGTMPYADNTALVIPVHN